MGLTDDGAIAIASALIGDGLVPLFTNANAAIGVGNNGTTFAVGQDMLISETSSASSATDNLRKAMDATYPQRDPDSDGSDNLIRFKATFGTTEGNFHWKEVGVFNSDTAGAGTMLLRVVQDLGTKTSADTWVATLDVTVDA